MSHGVDVLTAGAERAGRWTAVALGASIPVSVALDNVLLLAALICYALGGGYREKLAAIQSNPVVIAALALFAMLAAGTLYGPATSREALHYLGKYLDLLFVPVFAWSLRDAGDRRNAVIAFAAMLLVVLFFSFAIALGALPPNRLMLGSTGNPVVFKEYLTHNVLVALGAFLFCELALASTSRRARLMWGACAALAAVNILFLIPGRTGYLVLAALALYLGFQLARWRGFAAAGAVLVALLAALYAVSGPFQQRVDRALDEYSSWRPGEAAAVNNSVGLRLEFHANSLALFGDHPLAGIGTGGFPGAYAEKVRGTAMVATSNPHNEYLLIAVQTGLIGLALLLYLFHRQWQLAPRLAAPLETHLARGLLLAIAVGCLFNSLLLDHTEGLLYAWMTGLAYGGLQSSPRATHTKPR